MPSNIFMLEVKMKPKKILTLFILLMLLTTCLSLGAMAETKTSGEDAVIIFTGGRGGLLIHIQDIRENPKSNLNYSFWYNVTYLIREPVRLYYNNTMGPGGAVGNILVPTKLVSFGRLSVEVWVGNTYAKKTGLVIGRGIIIEL